MRTAETVFSIIRERGKRGLPLERVQHLLYNEELYLRAYAKLYPNKGAMTQGITDETVDAMSRRKIKGLIDDLRQRRFRWTPVRRIHIPKKKGTRPLGIPIWASYCTSLQNEFGIALTRLVAWVWIGRTDPHLFDCTIKFQDLPG